MHDFWSRPDTVYTGRGGNLALNWRQVGLGTRLSATLSLHAIIKHSSSFGFVPVSSLGLDSPQTKKTKTVLNSAPVFL